MTESFTRTPRPFDTIFLGGLTAGVLDAIDGVIAFGFTGLNPIQVLQYIASGALGFDAFKGGLVTAGIGAGFHFFITRRTLQTERLRGLAARTSRSMKTSVRSCGKKLIAF